MNRQSIKNQVYEDILKDILDGTYRPNAIINEKALIEKYNVSKTPIREALVQLCSEGVLNNIPRFGYQLSLITPAEIVEMIEYRKIIEVAALELCFDRLGPQQLEELREVNRQATLIEDSRDINAHWNINEMFHRRLCGFCGNRFLQKSLEDVLKFCTRIANQYFIKVWENDESEDDDHYEIVKAIEAGDLQRTREILIYDIEMMKNKML